MSSSPNRREVLVALTAATVTVPALTSAGAQTGLPKLAVGRPLVERAEAFQASLDEGQRVAASFPWGREQWRAWNYFGVGGYIKPGLRLEQMSEPQKAAAWALFEEVLSPAGLEKARNVMLLQDILAEAGNGRGLRSSERFSVSIFGAPAATGTFGVRLEGHHLSLSFVVRDGDLVSVTPAAFAALPNRVKGGRMAGLVTLKGEEQIARRLQNDLAPKLKTQAQVSERHLFNILSSAGRERSNTSKVGLAVSDMIESQRELLWQLVETYAVEPYKGALSDAQRSRISQGDRAAVHFAWYGPNEPERAFGYRVIGDTFVIELGSIDPEAQHLHPVYHDLANTLGAV